MRLENSFILIPRIGEKKERKFWQNGITHWNDLLKREEISGNRRERTEIFLQKAEKNLGVGNSIFFDEKLPNGSKWRMYENFREKACFFDIETTGLDAAKNKVTTVSFHRGGETKTLVRGEDLTRERLKQELFESSILVSFNGKRFDQPFLEKNFDISIETPHIDLMYLCRRIGATGGLKKIEQALGISRDLEDIDGREAVKLWKRYEKRGDAEALDRLVRYNQDDAVNLKLLLEEVRSRLRSRVFEPHLQGNS